MPVRVSLSMEAPAAVWHPDKPDLSLQHLTLHMLTHHSAFQIKRKVWWVTPHGGQAPTARSENPPNLCLHWLKHADMGDTRRKKKKERKSLNTDQNRLGNETLADAALTWQMGNEIVGSFRCVPLSVHPSIHRVIYPPAARKSRVGNPGHLKLLGQLSWDITPRPRRLWLGYRALTWQNGWPFFVSVLHTV